MSYREPHLQKKSDECAELWREWFSLFQTRDHNDLERKELRKKWCKCCDELSEMITNEVKTNPRYQGKKI